MHPTELPEKRRAAGRVRIDRRESSTPQGVDVALAVAPPAPDPCAFWPGVEAVVVEPVSADDCAFDDAALICV